VNKTYLRTCEALVGWEGEFLTLHNRKATTTLTFQLPLFTPIRGLGI
jgi:hypothetical protein